MPLSQTQLQILITAVDNASAVLQQVSGELNDSSTAAQQAGVNWADVGKQMGAAATALAPVAAIFDEIAKSSIESAANTQTAVESANTLIAATVSNANSGADTMAVQIGKLTAQINAQKATIDEATAALDKDSGSAESVAAAHDRAAASIATAQANIQTLSAKLELLQNQEGLVGESSDAISAQFLALADSQTDYGFKVEDSVTALSKFFSLTNSTADAIQAYTLAQNLSLVPGQSMQSATQAVTQALNGMGRGLSQIVPGMKDGLAGMDAINAAMSVLGGEKAAQANSFNVQIAALSANWDKLTNAFGNTDLNPLAEFLKYLNEILDKVTAWATANPQLAQSIETIVLVMAAMLTISVAVLGALAALALIVLALGGPFTVIAIIIAATATAVAVAVALIMQHWTELKTLIEALWQSTMHNLENDLSQMRSTFFTVLDEIHAYWNGAWQGMGDFLGQIWATIKGTVRDGVNDIIAGINYFINALDAIHISIPSIQIPGTKLGTPAVNLGFNIPDIPMLAEGGFVDAPTLAMIGEAGPEAVMPLSMLQGQGMMGQPVINVYIQGGNYLDAQGADMIAQALATKIQRNLKLTNFR